MVPPNPQVHSMALWNNTGVQIARTKNGKILSIVVDATTLWTANRFPGGGGHYDARGWIGHPAHYHNGYKCPGRNEGCLVVQIAEGGEMLQFTFDSPHVTVNGGKIQIILDVPADISGSVLMGINDAAGGLGDNDGILNILDISYRERP
ncbi:MAG TPA: hypothetical protein PKG90_11735 [Chitinophagaceae bacterium]|nr:hypothetical protein [Chitinophagaceae bacterium]